MIPSPPEWFDAAACADADPDLFTPDVGVDASAAQRVCARCPVADLCLDYALTVLPSRLLFGVWGGVTERQLRRMRSRHLGRRDVA